MDSRDIDETFSSLGPVTVKRMSGGRGIYHRDLILALEAGGELLPEADAAVHPAFAAAGARRWAYEGRDWSVPDAAYDDPDEMARWVRLAWEAAVRAKVAAFPGPARRDARR